MKLAIYGAGAIGSVVATRLIARGGHQVSVVARGQHLATMRADGITMVSRRATVNVRPADAVDDARLLGDQDIVIVTLKAHAVPYHADRIAGLLRPDGCVVFMTNGIPWWWRYGLPAHRGGNPVNLPLLDPAGALCDRLADRTVGCAVYCAAEITQPGTVRYSGYNRWLFGEPSQRGGTRASRIAGMFEDAGLSAIAVDDIRLEIWKKLVHNSAYNPISALTRLAGGDARSLPDLDALMIALVRETGAVAAACGWDISDEVESFTARAVRSGIRPSMLQDALAGKPMEVESIVGQLQAFGRDHDVPTPVLDVVVPLVRGLDHALARALIATDRLPDR